MEIQQIMTTEVSTAHPSQVVGEMYDLFDSVNYHHIPVVENGKLVGIISDRDVARSVSPFIGTDYERKEDGELMQKSVADIMTTTLITVDRTTSIDCASILLLENNISCLPIVDDEQALEGILTWKDILKFHVYHN